MRRTSFSQRIFLILCFILAISGGVFAGISSGRLARTPLIAAKSSTRTVALSTLGPDNFSTFSSLAGADAVWSTPSNAQTSNDTRTTAALSNAGNLQTNLLSCTGPATISIPAGARVDGITVEIERSTTGTGVKDLTVQIVKNGSAVGTNKASATTWPAVVDAYATYGSSSDKWGTTWVSTDINSTFGVVIAATLTNTDTGVDTARIDHVRVTVDYTAATRRRTTSIVTMAVFKNLRAA